MSNIMPDSTTTNETITMTHGHAAALMWDEPKATLFRQAMADATGRLGAEVATDAVRSMA